MESRNCRIWSTAAVFLLLLAVAACGGDKGSGRADGGADSGALDGGTGSDADPGDGGAWEDPPTVTSALTPSDAILLNPERGFYRTLSLVNDRNYSWVRDRGSTLAFSYVRLDDYRDRDLDAALLDAAAQGFVEARQAGIKIVLRFAYNFGPYPDSEPDASKAWVLQHISQLTPLIQQNVDVIAVVQAGFIGAWGEWHSSTNGLLDDPQTKFDILEALLAAVPYDRAVQLRYPPYKDEGYGGPLDDSTAHSQTSAARVGHHNDCFLASDTDMGTYPSNEIDQWKAFVEAETRWVPMGGETCSLNPPRSDCPTALAEMERFHYSYINHEYHPDVVSSWQDQGCRDEMERLLGYRFVGLTVTAPEAVRPGGVIPFTFRLRNEGYAALWNWRPIFVVLDGPDIRSAQVFSDLADPRWWLDGEESELRVRLQLPGALPLGSYSLCLWLPDAHTTLMMDPRYSIALANEGVWDQDMGWNCLVTVDVDPAAPGSSDPTAGELEVLPP
jgi:hypothetical protein